MIIYYTMRYDTGSCYLKTIIHTIHIILFIITLKIKTTEEIFN